MIPLPPHVVLLSAGALLASEPVSHSPETRICISQILCTQGQPIELHMLFTILFYVYSLVRLCLKAVLTTVEYSVLR